VHTCGALLGWDFVSNPWKLGTSCYDGKGLRAFATSYDQEIRDLIMQHADHSAGLFIDLLQGLLKFEPSERLEASEALRHPFFREHSRRSEYIACNSWVSMWPSVNLRLYLGLELLWMIVHCTWWKFILISFGHLSSWFCIIASIFGEWFGILCGVWGLNESLTSGNFVQ